jgi:hypothetical protein
VTTLDAWDKAWLAGARDRCQVFMTPDEATRARLKITDPDVVLGCPDAQGDGPAWMFIPVPEVGAARVGCCPRHLEELAAIYTGSEPDTGIIQVVPLAVTKDAGEYPDVTVTYRLHLAVHSKWRLGEVTSGDHWVNITVRPIPET